MPIFRLLKGLGSNSKYGRNEENLNRKIERDVKKLDLEVERHHLFKHERNRRDQLVITSKKFKRHVEQGLKLDSEIRVEFMFESRKAEFLHNLSEIYKKEGYDSNVEKDNRGKSKLKVISKPMKFQKDILREWVKEMCDMGYKSSCLFKEWSLKTD